MRIFISILSISLSGCMMNNNLGATNLYPEQTSRESKEATNNYYITANISSLAKTNIYAGDMFMVQSKILNYGDNDVLGSSIYWQYHLVVKQLYDKEMVLRNVAVQKGMSDEVAWQIVCANNGSLPSSATHGSSVPIIVTGQEIERKDPVVIPTPGVYEIYIIWKIQIENTKTGQREKIIIKSNMCEVNILPKQGVEYESFLRDKTIFEITK